MNCEVAHQLKIWSNEISATAELESLDGNFTQGSFLFDWCITSLPSICECFENCFGELFEKHNLDISAETDSNGYNYVTDRKYGIQFQHVFSRVGTIVTPEILESEYEDKRQKVSYLASKLRNLIDSDKTALYIRRGDDHVGLLGRLADAIKKINPNHDFHVVSVRSDGVRSIDERYAPYISFYQMPYSGDWTGDAQEWAKMLSLYVDSSASRSSGL